MRPITQQIQAIQALESAGASHELAEAIAVTLESSALAARDAAWERVEAKIDSMRTEVEAKLDSLRAEMNSRFDKVDVRFAVTDAKVAAVEANLERSLRVTTVSLVVFVMALIGVTLAVLRFFPAAR